MKIIQVSEARYIKNKDGYWDYKYRIKLVNQQWKDKTVRGKSRGWKGSAGKKKAIEHFRENSLIKEHVVQQYNMFSDVSQSFLQSIESTVSANTLRQETTRRSSILKYYGDFDMDSMLLKDISDMYNTLFKHYSTAGSFSKVKSFFIRTYEYGEVYFNIKPLNVRVVKTPKGKLQKKEITEENIFTQDEFADFIAFVEKNKQIAKTKQDHTDFLFGIQLLFWNGLRISEALNLKASDFHYNNDYDVHYFTITESKTDKGLRNVSVLDVFKPLYLRRIEYLKSFYGYTEDWYILSSNGKNKPYSYWRSLYEEYVHNYGKDTTLHKLRNSHATYLKSIGLTSNEIIDRMGHVDEKMTEAYQIKTLSQELQLAQKINNIGVKLGSNQI